MNPLPTSLSEPHAILYLGNVALAVLLSCAATLLAAFLFQRRSAPTRAGLLLLGLTMVLTSPALVWLTGRAGIGWLQIAAREPAQVPWRARRTHGSNCRSARRQNRSVPSKRP
jgi:hypothetical protein